MWIHTTWMTLGLFYVQSALSNGNLSTLSLILVIFNELADQKITELVKVIPNWGNETSQCISWWINWINRPAVGYFCVYTPGPVVDILLVHVFKVRQLNVQQNGAFSWGNPAHSWLPNPIYVCSLCSPLFEVAEPDFLPICSKIYT